VRVPAGQLLPVPTGVSLIEAAALPEVTCTVWSNVFLTANLQPGETLLVHGGSSGIGTMAIQLGRAIGAVVAVTAGSPEKLAACADLGAEVLVNYREEDFVDRVMAATDGAGAGRRARQHGGQVPGAQRLGARHGWPARGHRDAGRHSRRTRPRRAAAQAGRGHSRPSLRARPLGEKATIVAAVREHVWPLIEAGEVRPVVMSRHPLADAAAAHRELEASAHIGKILLTP
jgi:NADPH:quinone reductase-like Zn-dependent oxidoreductase